MVIIHSILNQYPETPVSRTLFNIIGIMSSIGWLFEQHQKPIYDLP